MTKIKCINFFDRLDEVEKDQSIAYLLPAKRSPANYFFRFVELLNGVIRKSTFEKRILNGGKVIKWLAEKGFLHLVDEFSSDKVYVLSEYIKKDMEEYFHVIENQFPKSSKQILEFFKESLSKSLVSDSDLNKDICTTLSSINKLEVSQIRRIKEYKSNLFSDKKDHRKKIKLTPKLDTYLVQEVKNLSRILSRFPLNISVDFYTKRPLRKKLSNIFLGLSKVKFPEISPFKRKYSPFGLKAARGENFYLIDQPFDMYMRELLGLVIFNYLIDLLNNKPERPRKCLFCKKWFLANKANHICCSKRCNDSFYSKTSKGRIKVAAASRRYRKDKKNNRSE